MQILPPSSSPRTIITRLVKAPSQADKLTVTRCGDIPNTSKHNLGDDQILSTDEAYESYEEYVVCKERINITEN